MENNKLSRIYSEAQQNYMLAAAAFQVVAKQQQISDDAYCAAFQLKIDTQRALFAWVRETVSTDPKTARTFASNAADLDRLFTDCWKFPSIREKLTDACLRLEVD